MKYDRKKCYSPKKLMILNFFFIFYTNMQFQTIAYKLGIKLTFLNNILHEWHDNDHFIIVESKINKMLEIENNQL